MSGESSARGGHAPAAPALYRGYNLVTYERSCPTFILRAHRVLVPVMHWRAGPEALARIREPRQAFSGIKTASVGP